MVRFVTFSLACSLLMSSVSGDLAGHQDSAQPSLSMETIIQVVDSSPHKVLQSVLSTAQQNRIPIGIVEGDSLADALCEKSLTLTPGKMTVSDFVAALQSSTLGYTGQIKNGVLEIRPQGSPNNVSAFLDLPISRFQSPSSPHIIFGSSLWMAIRGVIAPGEGTATDMLFSLDAETVPGLDIANKSVDFILDAIVKQGSGGVWVLHTAKLKVLSDMTPMPYEIHGYVGEGNLQSMIKCPTQ
jgi:hypothetical protein